MSWGSLLIMNKLNKKEKKLIASCMRFTISEIKIRFGESQNPIEKTISDSLISDINKLIEKLED